MFRKTVRVTTRGEGDIVDITPEVMSVVQESGYTHGIAHIFITGSTAAVTTTEYEPGVLDDLRRALAALAPADQPYRHDSRWGDGNGRSHVKASIVGPSLSVPVIDGDLATGTWQQIVLLELDTRSSRERIVVISIL
jgi:secondary thiamine-phosphate synthase enzyme